MTDCAADRLRDERDAIEAEIVAKEARIREECAAADYDGDLVAILEDELDALGRELRDLEDEILPEPVYRPILI